MLHLNKQFNNFCTTALFHHSETLHKRNVIKTAFPDSFLHSNICAHSSNYEASLVLTRSLLLALNRIAWLICKASTVTAFGHKAVFFFFSVMCQLSEVSISTEFVHKEFYHMAVITGKTRKVISEQHS